MLSLEFVAMAAAGPLDGALLLKMAASSVGSIAKRICYPSSFQNSSRLSKAGDWTTCAPNFAGKYKKKAHFGPNHFLVPL